MLLSGKKQDTSFRHREVLDVVYPKGRAEARVEDDEIEKEQDAEEQGRRAQVEETDENVIVTKDCDDLVKHLRVRYDGFCEEGEEIYASDSKYVSSLCLK